MRAAGAGERGGAAEGSGAGRRWPPGAALRPATERAQRRRLFALGFPWHCTLVCPLLHQSLLFNNISEQTYKKSVVRWLLAIAHFFLLLLFCLVVHEKSFDGLISWEMSFWSYYIFWCLCIPEFVVVIYMCIFAWKILSFLLLRGMHLSPHPLFHYLLLCKCHKYLNTETSDRVITLNNSRLGQQRVSCRFKNRFP